MDYQIYFNLNLANFLIISGVVQIFILSGILLYSRERNRLSNGLLSLLLLVISFYLSYLMILDLNLDNFFPWLLWIPYSYLLAVGPILYFYTLSYTKADFRITKKEKVHFVPLGVELLLQVVQIGWAVRTNEMYYNVHSDKLISPLIHIAVSISIVIYLKKSLKQIKNHEEAVLQQFSDVWKKTLSWLNSLLRYYRLFWFIWIPFAITFFVLFRGQIQNMFTVLTAYLLILSLTYLTYWIGLQGLLQGSLMKTNNSIVKDPKRRSYSHLSSDEIEALTNAIKQEMEDNKRYLNPTLSLREFSGFLGKEPNLISFILNKHFGKNFYEFVNSYRIAAVKLRLEKNSASNLTLLAIALECGFNSKTSFNRVFKEMTGLTPSQYLKRMKEN